MFDFDDRQARPIDTLRTQAEGLGLRIVEVGASRWMVTGKSGQVVYRASSLRDLQLCIELRRAEL